MRRKLPIRFSFMLAALLAASSSFAQAQSLSLDDALRLARERNGTLRAARLNVLAAQSNLRQSLGSFLPTVTPTYEYSTSRIDGHTGSIGKGGDAGSSLDVVATWRILDSGTRKLNAASSRSSLQAESASAVQTYRQLLFNVTQSYYEALRSQELVRVQQAQVERAQTLLDRTLAEIEVKRAAGKDRYQPQADLLNAQVSLLTAKNRYQSSIASLKSLIGLPMTSTNSPDLVPERSVEVPPLTEDLASYQQVALQQRSDLQAQRSRLKNQEASVRLAELDAGISYRIDATYTRSFARDVSDRTQLGLIASIPLFDGKRSREAVLSRKLSLQSGVETLTQSERSVQSEIESAYYDYQQSGQRLAAAEAALEAAQKNYDAVSAARKEGVSSLVDVVVASTTLTTAEVNRVEAVYDALIAKARWQLVIGEPIEGELELR